MRVLVLKLCRLYRVRSTPEITAEHCIITGSENSVVMRGARVPQNPTSPHKIRKGQTTTTTTTTYKHYLKT